jgi:uroporphyrinogen-III synthase
MRPLRVAVTRDEGPDGELSRALRERGLDPVACPAVVESESPDPGRLAGAARALERYDWLVVASRRAVEALIEARGGAPLPGTLRTAAVGDRTAAALAAHGARAPLTAERSGALALIEALRDAGPWPGRRCLLPRAQGGGTELADALRRLGAEVDEVVAYRTVERSPGEIAATWNEAHPDAVVVASPSAARALVGALGACALRSLRAVVAIGPTTRAALASLGVAAVTPPRADFESVAELLSGPLDAEREVRT